MTAEEKLIKIEYMIEDALHWQIKEDYPDSEFSDQATKNSFLLGYNLAGYKATQDDLRKILEFIKEGE